MSEGKQTALMPCPFCGGEPIMRRTVQEFPADADGPAGEYDAWFTLQCDDCGIEQGAEYRSEAVDAWNRRSSPSFPTLVEALEAAKVVIGMMERPDGMGDDVNAALDARLAKIDAALAAASTEGGQ